MSLFIHRNAGGRCPCGAENATCGPPSSVVPVDQLIEEVPAVSGPLKKYKVTRGGVETVMKLSDDDAKRLGVGPDAALDEVSTIQTVQPVASDETAGVSGAGDDAGDVTPAAGGDAAAAQPVAPGGDGQAAAAPAAAPGDHTQAPEPEPVKAAAAKKTAAKRQPAAANKARTAAPNKAADGGS